MSTPLRPCVRAECRLCHPEREEKGDSLAELLVGAAMLVVVFILFFLLLPVLAA